MLYPSGFLGLCDKLKDPGLCQFESFEGEHNVQLIRQTRRYPMRYLIYEESCYPEGVEAWIRLGSDLEDGDELWEINANCAAWFDVWDYDQVCRIFPKLYCEIVKMYIAGARSKYKAHVVPTIRQPSTVDPPKGYKWWYSVSPNPNNFECLETGFHIYYPKNKIPGEDISVLTSNDEVIHWVQGKYGLTRHICEKYCLTPKPLE